MRTNTTLNKNIGGFTFCCSVADKQRFVLCLNLERLQTDVFEEQTYTEDFMAKVRGHTHTRTDTHTTACSLLFASVFTVLSAPCPIIKRLWRARWRPHNKTLRLLNS